MGVVIFLMYKILKNLPTQISAENFYFTFYSLKIELVRKVYRCQMLYIYTVKPVNNEVTKGREKYDLYAFSAFTQRFIWDVVSKRLDNS